MGDLFDVPWPILLFKAAHGQILPLSVLRQFPTVTLANCQAQR